MDYTTQMTPRSGDGGRDIEVERSVPGSTERSLVECKLWTRPVGSPELRSLLGAVAKESDTKGVLATPGHFTRPARDLAHSDSRLEILAWTELLPLLDEHLGADWGVWIDKYISGSIQCSGE